MTTVNVVSDLYKAGMTQDGAAYIGEVFFVQVDFDDGTSWRHQTSFNGVEAEMDDEGYYFINVIENASVRAETLAQKVRAHLESGGDLCITYWDVQSPLFLDEFVNDRIFEADERAWFNDIIGQAA